MNLTDHTGIYLDTRAEREERDASLAGMWETTPIQLSDVELSDIANEVSRWEPWERQTYNPRMV